VSPKELKNLASDIDDISRSMALARSEEVMNKALKMAKRPQSCRTEADDWAKPFSLLLDKINNGFNPLSLQNPREDINRRLAIELKILDWQLEKGQIIQAILLSREWTVTFYANQLGKDILTGRDETEQMLNSQAKLQLSEKKDINKSELISIWSDLIQLRNDVAHCGMRKNPMQSVSLEKRAKEVVLRLSRLMQTGNEEPRAAS